MIASTMLSPDGGVLRAGAVTPAHARGCAGRPMDKTTDLAIGITHSSTAIQAYATYVLNFVCTRPSHLAGHAKDDSTRNTNCPELTPRVPTTPCTAMHKSGDISTAVSCCPNSCAWMRSLYILPFQATFDCTTRSVERASQLKQGLHRPRNQARMN